MNDTDFLKFIKLLSDNDLLKHVILIGSWAEFVYKRTNLLPEEYNPNIRTRDVDFLLKNMRKPEPPVSLSALAREEGYFVNEDRLNGTTKFQKNNFEIEFLIEQKGSGVYPTVKTNLGVTAQALRHMNILSENVFVAKYFAFEITLPHPEAYAIHKIVINRERNRKAEKDMNAILNIWPYLDNEKLTEIANQLTKKEHAAFSEFLSNIIDKHESLDSKLAGAKLGLDRQLEEANREIKKQEEAYHGKHSLEEIH